MEEVLKELLSRRERSLINDEGLRQSAVLVPLFTKDGIAPYPLHQKEPEG